MTCNNCAHWQCPNKLRNKNRWSDCYRVIGYLTPEILRIKTRFGFYITLPWSPHDSKYIDGMLIKMNLDDGVRIEMVTKEDVVYDTEGNERRKKVKLPFYQTHKDYGCEMYTPLP